jgi:hypothetical protein
MRGNSVQPSLRDPQQREKAEALRLTEPRSTVCWERRRPACRFWRLAKNIRRARAEYHAVEFIHALSVGETPTGATETVALPGMRW